MVTLYGKAQNAAEKDLATKPANDVNGVKGIKEPIDYRIVLIEEKKEECL